MELTDREKLVLEAVAMHPKKGGSSRRDFCSYIAGATGFAASTSRDTLSSLKRKGALVGGCGYYYTLDSKYAEEQNLVAVAPGLYSFSEPEENGVEAPVEEQEEEEAEEQEEEEAEAQEQEEEFENPAITASNVDLRRACRYLLKVMRKHNIQSVTLQKDGEITVGQLWVEEHNLSLGK